jgi:hypothetical protein
MIINVTQTKQIEVEIEVEIPYFYKQVTFSDNLRRSILYGKICESWHGTIEITEDLKQQKITDIEIEKELLRSLESVSWDYIERQSISNAIEYSGAYNRALQFIQTQWH